MINSKSVNLSERESEMYNNCYCAECDRLAQYKLDERNNCFLQSPLNEKHCANFIPNRDKI